MKLKNILLAAVVVTGASQLWAEKLVILHTNDSHSQIDPLDNGQGGVLRRKAALDSIRSVNENVLLIDAGDAVQGTMYFTIYKGEVEYGMLDELGYDIAIVGNHDFDNGVGELEKNLSRSKTSWLSSNYDFSGAPGLDSIFQPYKVMEYSGKKIGLMGINLVPEGMIAKGNYDGVIYEDAYKVANETARKLRHDLGADYVIAVTHIGYDGSVDPNDSHLAMQSEGIDLIIGGHSHSVIDPQNETERYYWKHVNAKGDTIGVVQAGSRGAYLGQVTLDLKNGGMEYELLPIDSRFDDRIDSSLVAVIDRYRNSVDSIMLIPVGATARVLGKEDSGLMNFLGEFVANRGKELTGLTADMSIINSGGVRRELPEGEISKGMIIDMLPFNNRVVVLEIKGSDLLEAIKNVIRRGGNDGVTKGVEITYNPETKEPIEINLNGRGLKPDEIYILATIDYLANGGDYMTSLPNAREIARSSQVLYDDLIDYISVQWKDKPLDGSPVKRVHPE